MGMWDTVSVDSATVKGCAAARAANASAATASQAPARATRRGRLPLAESLLRSAGIPFTVMGEYMPQLTGLDVYGPAELYVSSADADDARTLLADLDR